MPVAGKVARLFHTLKNLAVLALTQGKRVYFFLSLCKVAKMARLFVFGVKVAILWKRPEPRAGDSFAVRRDTHFLPGATQGAGIDSLAFAGLGFQHFCRPRAVRQSGKQERFGVQSLVGSGSARDAPSHTDDCSAPPSGHARWTIRLLAEHVVERRIVETAHFNTVGRALKKTTSNRT